MATVVAIEFTDVDCRIVQAETRKGKKPQVRAATKLDLPKADDLAMRVAQRGEAIRAAMKAARIKAEQAHVIIPKNFVMARMVNLPSTNEDEIVGMARFEAERHIPFNAERHIVSHHTLAKQGMQGSDVMLTAVDQPIAQEYLDTVVAAGLRVDTIGVSSLSAFNAFAAAEPTGMADRVVAVVNVGRSATDLVIANNGLVNFTRGPTLGLNKLFAELQEADPDLKIDLADLPDIDALEPHLYFRLPDEPLPLPVPSYDPLDPNSQPAPPPAFGSAVTPETSLETVALGQLTDSEMAPPPPPPPPPPSAAVAPENKKANVFRGWLLRLLQEVRRTYEFAHREFNVPMISHIYICGEGATIRNLSHYFRANFGIEASVFDPLRGVETSSKLQKQMEGQGNVYAAAIGALVVDTVPQAIKSNLLPPDYRLRLSAKEQQRAYITTGVLLLVALGMGYWYMSDVFAQQQNLRNQLFEQNQRDKKRVADLDAKRERLNIIRQNVQEDTGMLAVLEQISKIPLIPERKISLTRFEYKRADYVKIAGHARDLPSANQMLSQYVRNMATAEGERFFEDARMDDGSLQWRQLRGRGNEQVLDYSITATFPKPKKRPARPTETTTDSPEGEEAGGS